MLSCFLVAVSFAWSTAAENRMNLALHRAILSDSSSARIIDVLVQGDPSAIRGWSEIAGTQFIRNAGTICWLRIPQNKLAALHENNFVQRIEAFPMNVSVLNDTMRSLTRADWAHQGIWLPQSYKGNGVLMGYIDSGIDFSHPDFKDSMGNTRVRWIWDMTLPVSSNTPQPYGYGQEWNNTEIDAGAAAAHTGQQEYGHGTYVTGIGSGNGRALGHFQGVAPESELIIVNYNFQANDTVPRYAHAVDYIFSKATQLGKPCVINASLGDYYGSHDGRDLQSQFISNLIDQQPGRILVAAAGNAGIDNKIHVGRSLSAGDTAFTWFKYNSGFGGAYAQIFADSAEMVGLRFSIGVDKVTPYYQPRVTLGWRNITNVLSGVVTNLALVNGNRIGVVQMLGTNLGGVYMLEVFVVPDSIDYNWRLSLTGNGHYDGWNFDWVSQNLPTSSVFPPIVNYQAPDTLQSIVSGFACLNNVITVGNYFNTDRHIDVNNTLQISPNDKPLQLATNSSRGPTRDGRLKPEICAPGHHILSTGVLATMPAMIASTPWKVAAGGYHITGGGTSASTPVVAGIAALYLQQNPNAYWYQFKDALTLCAATDQYVWGPLPNPAWGYGKADAIGTLFCSVTSTNSLDESAEKVAVYPNPASTVLNIQTSWTFEQIDLLSSEGKLVATYSYDAALNGLHIADLPNGLYFVRIVDKNGVKSLKSFMKTNE